MSKKDLPKILVCGGRYFTNKGGLYSAMDKLCEQKGWVTKKDRHGNYLPEVIVIHGCAPGADALADDWAITNHCQSMRFPANWAKYGNAAGPIRNEKMLKDGRPDLVVAFPGGRGTHNMISQSRDMGVPVYEVSVKELIR